MPPGPGAEGTTGQPMLSREEERSWAPTPLAAPSLQRGGITQLDGRSVLEIFKLTGKVRRAHAEKYGFLASLKSTYGARACIL